MTATKNPITKKKRKAAPGDRPRSKKPFDPSHKLVDEFDAAKSDAERDAIAAREVAAFAAYVPDDPEVARLLREDNELLRKDRAKRGRGRPKVGRGAAKFNVTMEQSLLERVDAYAREHRMARAAVIAMGCERLIGA